jgi:hypothetical protein
MIWLIYHTIYPFHSSLGILICWMNTVSQRLHSTIFKKKKTFFLKPIFFLHFFLIWTKIHLLSVSQIIFWNSITTFEWMWVESQMRDNLIYAKINDCENYQIKPKRFVLLIHTRYCSGLIKHACEQELQHWLPCKHKLHTKKLVFRGNNSMM